MEWAIRITYTTAEESNAPARGEWFLDRNGEIEIDLTPNCIYSNFEDAVDHVSEICEEGVVKVEIIQADSVRGE